MSVIRVAAIVFAAAAFYGKCQEEQAEEQPWPLLTPTTLHSIHRQADKDNNGKVSLLEMLDWALQKRRELQSLNPQRLLDQVDNDGDGNVSFEELTTILGFSNEDDQKKLERDIDFEMQKFKLADVNSDGLVSPDEIPALLTPESDNAALEIMTKHALAEKDTDGNGQLSFKEFHVGEHLGDAEGDAEAEENFKMLDEDGNGLLSLEELKPWAGGVFHARESIKRIIEIADKDKDMHVTKNEFHKAMRKINKDKFINEHFSEFLLNSEL